MRDLALTERRAAYYQVLHEHPEFEAELRKLFRTLFPEFTRARTPQQWMRALDRVNARGTRPADDARVQAFAKRWKLPAVIRWTSAFLSTASEGAEPRLRALLSPRERVQITPVVSLPSTREDALGRAPSRGL